MQPSPVWIPSAETIASANVTHAMAELSLRHVKDFHAWSTAHYQDFWQLVLQKLKIVFQLQPQATCNLNNGITAPIWFPGAKMNIADSCFTANATKTALIYEDQNKQLCHMSYGELDALTNQIANSLITKGFIKGDVIAIIMPMCHQAVAIYLGIIKMGGIVVSIADSFSSQEIASRLEIAKAKYIFIQDNIAWASEPIPLYKKITESVQLDMVVLASKPTDHINVRPNDITWQQFLIADAQAQSIACAPMDTCHILFSSGTTAQPKAIPWNHTTPIKAASDAYFHQNIKPDDVLTWPTNLGWMMGPWLVFAALINQASIALYTSSPKDRAFGEFVQRAKVTMLGVVPTLVAHWKQTHCMEGLDWQHIKVFSSTGECSNATDMAYLMQLGGGKPIIEYCGGTEIGGAYVTSTVVEDNYPAQFSTPAMGLNFTIIDEQGLPTDSGEVAIIPPSIGLSTALLNADHQHIYYDNMPHTHDDIPLRRHGDQIQRLPNGYYCMLGRVDDTMNLGGIKISAAEIERTLIGLPNIIETAAVATATPSKLIIYAATAAELDKQNIMSDMQKRISEQLNPLFKIHDVIFLRELPKTASNKIMRRMLRQTN